MNIAGDIAKPISNIKQTIDRSQLMFLQEDNIIKLFNNNLELNFNLYSTFGYQFNYKDNIFKSLTLNQKIIFELNLFYKWLNVDYPPRFTLTIVKNNINYITRQLGINDTLDTNNIYLNLIIDINSEDNIKFILNRDGDVGLFEIFDNSYYILKSI
jgi:hypothetical protein